VKMNFAIGGYAPSMFLPHMMSCDPLFGNLLITSDVTAALGVARD
jgi:hypothetical protein